MEKARVILIRRSRLTETSLIVHWCSLEHGLFKTAAKGALRAGSPFLGKLDLFYQAEIEFVRSRRSDLHTLRDIAVLDSRAGIRASYPRTLAASYFVRLLETLCERETPVPDFFRLLQRSLDYLDRREPEWKAVLHFESEAARLLGVSAGRGEGIAALRELHHRIPRQREELSALLDRPELPGAG